ncbi:MAG: DinB family protein [Gemmatirosa sp.]
MHPRVAELVDQLTRGRAALLASVAAVPGDQLEQRPTPDGWSVAEIVDHLQSVEAGSARLLAKRLQRAREQGVGPETEESSVLGRLEAFDIVGRPKRQAPEMVHPRAGVTAEQALTGLQEAREALLAVLRDGDGLALGQVMAVHPVIGDLDLYGWVVFIAQHEERHERQIRALGEALAQQAAAER